MSNNGSAKGSNNSHSGSSSSSPNQAMMLRDNNDLTDLTLFGSQAQFFSRTGTVRRASSAASAKKEKDASIDDAVETLNGSQQSKSGRSSPELFYNNRKSLDSSFRLSLESISEYKTKSSFSAASVFASRDCSSSLESTSYSDCTDYAIRSSTETATNKEDNQKNSNKTLLSPGSSYLSWIESVNSEYFGSATSSSAGPVVEVDNKVGEWNNFWLNYSCDRGRYLTSPYLSASNDERTGNLDDLSDAKSTCSTQREFANEKNSLEQVLLSSDEVNEVIRCSQRITEILQTALKRNEMDFDDSKNESYYSQPYSQHNSVKEEAAVASAPRERSFSYAVDATELQKQKQLLKPTPQSSSSSCINALLNTGVADILKRVITKRRDVLTDDEPSAMSARSSFSEWSSTK